MKGEAFPGFRIKPRWNSQLEKNCTYATDLSTTTGSNRVIGQSLWNLCM
jgi:hypothetical protein